ncbi:DENN domain-containing protein 1A isoform X5 [Oratosquilla oratoria]|uniref:DENN domain-containing protein 1A isoform X5 n=1 Tax=Oratosquilla oratoria TaxID=337810 RepID=UPI003F76E36A
MGSRLRDSPQRLFECWCEVVGPNDDTPAWIIQKFPKTYDEGEVLKSVPQFAFPCTFENSNVQHFSFVLTSLDSKWTYGFCRHAAKAETALVLLSFLPWHEVFYKLLNVCSDYLSSSSPEDVWLCLQEAYRCPTPAPGSDLVLPLPNDQHFMVQCPNHLRLPTIPDNRNLTEYYNAVDVNNMMIVFASMLYERRIIVTSKRLSRLSACVQAANAVLYPMVWQHIFIPVLPQHLVDYLLAPMPFLIGVCSSLLSKVRTEDIGEAVVLDADNNAVTTPFDDLASLPDEVIFNLKRSLKGNGGGMLGDVVARAFLRALVQLMGNYREALQFREEDKKITFNQEKFVAIRPPAFQPFVENMLHLQIFQQFIEERLQLLNSGKQTSDDFESEVSMHSDRSASKVRQQYKHFVTTFRKEGGAIMKTVKSKTNPAVKSAVKSVTKGGKQVKEKSRQTYKDLRGKIRDLQIPKEGTTTWETNGENYVVPKPRSAPSSPVLSAKRRPRTMGPGVAITAKTTYKRASQINIREDTGVLPGTRKYDLMESSSRLASPISSDGLHTPSPQDIDLMGEMEEILKTKLGQEEGSSPNHVSKQSVSSTSQVSTSAASSVSNSICNSVSNSPTVGNSLVAPQRRLARDNKLPSPLASRKLRKSISLSCDFVYDTQQNYSVVRGNVYRGDGGQDLIYLESPQEELFDPLLSKEIPRSLPCLSQHQTLSSLKGPKPVQETSKLGNVSQSASSLPAPMASMLTNSSFNKTGLPSATPPRPAASMQGVSSEGRQYGSMQYNFGVPVGCNNPSYSQHQPPLGSGLVAAAKEKLSLASGVQTTPALGLTGNSSTRLGSATAAFASTMLQNPTDSGPSSGQYVQFQPPLRTKKDTSSKPLSSSSGTEHNHLLGDFSQDFKKLSVSGSQPSVAARAKDINLSTSNINNNNNNVQDKDTIANAKETKPVQPKPSEAPVRWMTFD